MNERYLPRTTEGRLGWLVEECGEVQAAIGKTLRFGLSSFNPELPEEEQETNADWILRECRDLRAALDAVERALSKSERVAKAQPKHMLDDLGSISAAEMRRRMTRARAGKRGKP